MTDGTSTEAFDFAELDVLVENQENGTELKLRHPTKGSLLGPSLMVVSYESKRVQECQRRLTERRVREGRRVSSPEEQEEETIEICAAAVVGFGPVPPVVDGVPLDYTAENVRKFLRRFKFVRSQVDTHAGTLSSFLPS